MGVVLLFLVFLPIAIAVVLTVMGVWLLLTRKARPAVALSLTIAPTFAAFWTFGGYRGLSVPLLTGDLAGMPPNLHLAGILLAFFAVQAALSTLVRRGPASGFALVCMVLCFCSLAGPLLVHSEQREAMQHVAARSAPDALPPAVAP